jgi:hypothetical protein
MSRVSAVPFGSVFDDFSKAKDWTSGLQEDRDQTELGPDRGLVLVEDQHAPVSRSKLRQCIGIRCVKKTTALCVTVLSCQ